MVPAKAAFVFLGLATTVCFPMLGQEKAERFWVAGRYDGNRIVVYFNKVRFAGTMTSRARKIAPPVVEGFFNPVELPANFIAGFQKTGDAEHFALRDRYDLMLGNGGMATIKLTALVGCETDEAVGNDSFIGALATVERPDDLAFTRGYYAVRRHREPRNTGLAGLRGEPIRFDDETRIAALLDQRMKVEATDAERRLAGGAAPALKVQPFQLADGSLRYYVRAEWRSGKETDLQYPYTLGAWITPLPDLRILAVDQRTSEGYASAEGLPELLNVVDLGAGKTGIIIHVSYDDGIALNLCEYRDGIGTQNMPVMQSLSFGE